MVAHALEESPEVRFFFVPRSAAIVEAFRDRFLAGLGIVLLVPLLQVGFAKGLRIAGSVRARRFVFASISAAKRRDLRSRAPRAHRVTENEHHLFSAEIQAKTNLRALTLPAILRPFAKPT